VVPIRAAGYRPDPAFVPADSAAQAAGDRLAALSQADQRAWLRVHFAAVRAGVSIAFADLR
jgi:hypothetical protein